MPKKIFFAARLVLVLALIVFLGWKAVHVGYVEDDGAGPQVTLSVVDNFHYKARASDAAPVLERIEHSCSNGNGMEGDFARVKKFPVRIYGVAFDKGGVWRISISLPRDAELLSYSGNLEWEDKGRHGPYLTYRGEREIAHKRVAFNYELAPNSAGMPMMLTGRVWAYDYFMNSSRIDSLLTVSTNRLCSFGE